MAKDPILDVARKVSRLASEAANQKRIIERLEGEMRDRQAKHAKLVKECEAARSERNELESSALAGVTPVSDE